MRPPTRPARSSRPRAHSELGCGLGLVTIAAMRAGHDVLATDYYEDATLLTARNSLRVTGSEPALRMVDWRDFRPTSGVVDLVLAADVLYEKPMRRSWPRQSSGRSRRAGTRS